MVTTALYKFIKALSMSASLGRENKGFERMLEKVVVVLFDILFWHLQEEMRKL